MHIEDGSLFPWCDTEANETIYGMPLLWARIAHDSLKL